MKPWACFSRKIAQNSCVFLPGKQFTLTRSVDKDELPPGGSVRLWAGGCLLVPGAGHPGSCALPQAGGLETSGGFLKAVC